MGRKFPGFKQCLAMMRTPRDPQRQEEGFHALLPHAAEFVPELMFEFNRETDHGLRCWLLELIGSTGSTASFDILLKNLRSESRSLRYWAIVGLKKLDTKEARTVLWEARSWQLSTPEQTREFQADLKSVMEESKPPR